MKKVLIGFAEAFAAIESAWSLRDAGFHVVAFARRGARPPVRRVRGIELHAISAPEVSTADARADLAQLVQAVAPDVFLPLDDAAVFLTDALHDEEPAIAGPTGRARELALDKARQLDAARAAGLPVPPTTVVSDLADVAIDRYPAVVKPARALYEAAGRLVRPTGAVVADASELHALDPKDWYPPLLVQPLLRGAGEGLFGVVTSDGVIGWSAHRRVRMLNPQGSASSACESQVVDAALVAPTERFLAAADWTGLFMLEFLRDDEGRPWLMELNGRPWGSMALARRRGFEYPAWAAALALERGFVPTGLSSAPPSIRCRHLGMEMAHLAFLLRGPRSKALTEWPRFWPTLGSMARISRRDRVYNWRRSEPDVLIADTAAFLRFYLRRAAGGAR